MLYMNRQLIPESCLADCKLTLHHLRLTTITLYRCQFGLISIIFFHIEIVSYHKIALPPSLTKKYFIGIHLLEIKIYIYLDPVAMDFSSQDLNN